MGVIQELREKSVDVTEYVVHYNCSLLWWGVVKGCKIHVYMTRLQLYFAQTAAVLCLTCEVLLVCCVPNVSTRDKMPVMPDVNAKISKRLESGNEVRLCIWYLCKLNDSWDRPRTGKQFNMGSDRDGSRFTLGVMINVCICQLKRSLTQQQNVSSIKLIKMFS